MGKPKVLAINLPQFHPFSENNEWWGEGFTEWTNVTNAKPVFKNHNQPQLPTDLGFYDLRLEEARIAQAELAKQYSIDGFAYYHYWFSGKRLMKEPIDEILKSKKPDFPFCYFWANESWSRRWLGEDKEILIEQNYSEEDDKMHAEWLVESFKDERYIKINNRPIFLIYKPFDLPNSKRTIEIFSEVCLANGIEKPYFIASNSHNDTTNPFNLGFDHCLHFQPRLQVLSQFLKDGPTLTRTIRNILQGHFSASLKIYNYKQYKKSIKKIKFTHKGFPCVLVGFDNTARRGKNGIILKNQNIDDYKESLILAKNDIAEFPDEEKLIFINAWNEWAEGNHLEPCRTFGRAFLEATKEILGN
jgi:lipopolysaccharide biosynthesis protein